MLKTQKLVIPCFKGLPKIVEVEPIAQTYKLSDNQKLLIEFEIKQDQDHEIQIALDDGGEVLSVFIEYDIVNIYIDGRSVL